MPRHNLRSVSSFLKGPNSRSDQPVLFARPMAERCATVVRLKELAESLFSERLRTLASDRGGYSYDPCGLFLVLMFGYMQGVRSSRKLEEACRFDCRYEYLSGGLEPDHATLARFRRSLGSELEELFLLLCREAERRGILERRSMAVDGTKVAAVRSQWGRALKEAEATDEFEARIVFNHGEYLLGYNLQVAADTDSGMIVGYVATNVAADQVQMDSVVDACLRQSGALPESAVADKGYDSSRNAYALAQAGVAGVLPRSDPRRRPPFRIDEIGQVVCPAGHVAHEMRKNSSGRGPRRVFRVYKCRTSPRKPECKILGDSRDFTFTAGTSAESRLVANAKAESQEGQRLMRVRGPTIERVFGQFKGNQGFRRLLLRGVRGAHLELGLMSLGYNLKTLMR